MKNKIILLAIGFAALLMFTFSILVFQSKNSMYEIQKNGYLINGTEYVEVSVGDKVRTTTGDIVYVNGETYDGNSFYVSEDKKEMVVLNDAYLVTENAKISPIEKNTKIIKSSEGYEYPTNDSSVHFESGIVYNSDDPTYLVMGDENKIGDTYISDEFVLSVDDGGSASIVNIDDMTKQSFLMGDETITVAENTIDTKKREYHVGDEVVMLTNEPIIIEETEQKNDEQTEMQETIDEVDTSNNVTNTVAQTTTNSSNTSTSSNSQSQTIVYDNETAPTESQEDFSSITGLGKFFYDLFTFNPDYVPTMVLTVIPTYSTVTFDVSVEDVGGTFESMVMQLTDTSTGVQTFYPIMPVNGAASVKITNLKPGTEYEYSFLITYKNGKGESVNNLAKSGMFTTKDYELFITTYQIQDSQITLKVEVPSELSYTSGTIALYDEGNVLVEEIPINFEEIATYGFTYVTFDNLNSNSTYTYKLKDVKLPDGKLVDIGIEDDLLTAKKTPIIKEPVVTLDFVNGCFNVKASYVSDPDFAVDYVTFYVYNFDDTTTPIEEETVPFNSASASYKFCINSSSKLKRNKNYKFAIELGGNNNYEDFKLKSKISDSYMIDGIAPPSAEIDILSTTDDMISGTVTLVDDEAAIITNAVLQVKKTTTGEVVDSMVIEVGMTEFRFENLEPGTSYTIEVVTSFDLENGGPPYTNYPIKSISAYTTGGSKISGILNE